MKAVVVETDGKNAVVLDKNGDFIKTKARRGYRVGCEVEISWVLEFRTKAMAKYGSAAAAVLLFTFFGYGTYLYATPYSYVDIDINPSVELTANIFDRIIKTEALSDDGKKLLESNSLSNRNIQEGVKIVLESARKEGYISSGGQNEVVVTVSGKNDVKVGKVENAVKTAASNEIEAAGPDTGVTVEKISAQSHSEARKMGISPGKLLLIEKLKKYEPNLDVKEYKDKPVKEIMKSINERKKAEELEKQERDRKSKAQEKPDRQQAAEDTGIDFGGGDTKKAVSPGKDMGKVNDRDNRDKRNEENNKGDGNKPGRSSGKDDSIKGNDKNNESYGNNKSKLTDTKKDNNKVKNENKNKESDRYKNPVQSKDKNENKDKPSDRYRNSGQSKDKKENAGKNRTGSLRKDND